MADTPRDAARRLEPDDLQWRCDPACLGPLRDVQGTPTLIGQARAIEALRLGLAMRSPGYNIFVCGPSGTGKTSTVRTLLESEVERTRPPRDFVYVHNFDDPDRPRLLELPGGMARRLRRDFETLVEQLPEMIRRFIEADPVDKRRRALERDIEQLEERLLADFEARCEAQRFALVQVQMGGVQHIDIMPVWKRKPIDIDELNDIARTGQGRVPRLAETNRRHAELKDELRTVLGQLRRAAFKLQREVDELESEAVRTGLAEPFADLFEEYPIEGVARWLERAARWVAEHRHRFAEDSDEDGPVRDEPPRALRVNVVLDNHASNGPPVVFENFPTFTNLLGTVERPSDEARPTVDFNDIRGGSILRADGGFLVFNANDAVVENGVWRALTRVLKTRELEIQSPEQYFGHGGSTALKPEPVPIEVKVIAVGDDDLYRMLYSGTEDFRRIFKIKADFDDVMPRDDHGLRIYAGHVHRVIDEEQLTSLDDEALARLTEFGVRLSGRRDRLSTRFSDLTDVLREACHAARTAGADTTTAQHVEDALDARRHRHALPEDRLRDVIDRGIVDVHTEGRSVGSVNALTVLDLGDHAFGQPVRITATCAPGHDGITSVEREVELSGRLHDKGTLILTGYLRARYRADAPTALAATLAFEQMHDELDGDSASLAEAVALLSAIARVPVRQGIAMTGAVDQTGRVHAVGGLNEKIEGFFHVCRVRGLDGAQGVVIPAANEEHLQLDDDVVDAVRAGQFHVWSVRHIDAVLARVTDLLVGEADDAGRFPKGSLNRRVADRLTELSDQAGPRCGVVRR